MAVSFADRAKRERHLVADADRRLQPMLRAAQEMAARGAAADLNHQYRKVMFAAGELLARHKSWPDPTAQRGLVMDVLARMLEQGAMGEEGVEAILKLLPMDELKAIVVRVPTGRQMPARAHDVTTIAHECVKARGGPQG